MSISPKNRHSAEVVALTLLLQALAAFTLGALFLFYGVRWMRAGGTFTDSSGIQQSGCVAGFGGLLFGLICAVTAVLMARDVEPKLWVVAAAIVGPLLGVRAAWQASAVASIERLLGDVRQCMREGNAPISITIPGFSVAHSVVRMALLVERPAQPPPPGDYRGAQRRQAPDYLARVDANIARGRRDGLRALTVGLIPCLTPPAAALFFVLGAVPLEPLGWQVLAACCALASLCGASLWWVRVQTRRAAEGVRALLEEPTEA